MSHQKIEANATSAALSSFGQFMVTKHCIQSASASVTNCCKYLKGMVARDGVEPPTPAFSGLSSPIQNPRQVRILGILVILWSVNEPAHRGRAQGFPGVSYSPGRHAIRHLDRAPLFFGYVLRVNVQRGLNLRVPHQTLDRFDVCTGFDHPGCPRGAQTAPVGKIQTQLACGRLQMTGEEKIAHDIRNQYTIAYAPTNRKRDGTYRVIEVIARTPGRGRLSVRTRTGYFAPSALPSAPSKATDHDVHN